MMRSRIAAAEPEQAKKHGGFLLASWLFAAAWSATAKVNPPADSRRCAVDFGSPSD
jgi:hypothetical protein